MAKPKVDGRERVFAYASPYTSDDYALDAGHGWDRLASIAGEYQRGEITWAEARALCDDNARDLQAARSEEAKKTLREDN